MITCLVRYIYYYLSLFLLLLLFFIIIFIIIIIIIIIKQIKWNRYELILILKSRIFPIIAYNVTLYIWI